MAGRKHSTSAYSSKYQRNWMLWMLPAPGCAVCTLQATKHGRHMFLAAPGSENALHVLLATELLRSAALQTAKANTPQCYSRDLLHRLKVLPELKQQQRRWNGDERVIELGGGKALQHFHFIFKGFDFNAHNHGTRCSTATCGKSLGSSPLLKAETRLRKSLYDTGRATWIHNIEWECKK